MTDFPDLADLPGPLLVALLAGDEREVDAVFRKAVARGSDPALLARDLVQPALDEVGRLWEKGDIGVAEEHLATALASRAFLMNASCEKAPPLGAPRLVLTCLAGEFHELGVRLAAEIGRGEGWQVELLGANVPRDSALEYIALREPEAVGLSLSLAGHVVEAAALIGRVRSVAPGAKVLVGGVAFRRDPSLADATGADACVADPMALRDWLRAHHVARPVPVPPALRGRPRRTGSRARGGLQ